MYSKLLLAIVVALYSSASLARPLQQILQDSLLRDPALAEARANERIAGTTLAQTEAQRWPVLTAKANQPIINSGSNGRKGLRPALEANWTVYDFGRSDAEIERDEFKVDYFGYKTDEAAEELIYELAGYYLEGLRDKSALEVAEKNLQRHSGIVHKLKIIADIDPGRRSELTQAQSRFLQVQDSIVNLKRKLGLTLLRLSRFVSPAVGKNELVDPFAHSSVSDLVAKYDFREKSVQNHPSYSAQKKELNSIEAELKAAERARWPSLNLVGEVSNHGSALYLDVKMDVLNRSTAANVDEKRYQIQAAQARLTEIEQNLRERGELAELKMREDQARIDIAGKQIVALKQVARDYEDQFSIAQKSLLEVLNAYAELATVEQIEVQANYDLMLAKLDYLSAVGALRQWAGINQSAHPAVQTLPSKQQQADISHNTDQPLPDDVALVHIDKPAEYDAQHKLISIIQDTKATPYATPSMKPLLPVR